MFSVVYVAKSLVFCVFYFEPLFTSCHASIGHCIVCLLWFWLSFGVFELFDTFQMSYIIKASDSRWLLNEDQGWNYSSLYLNWLIVGRLRFRKVYVLSHLSQGCLSCSTRQKQPRFLAMSIVTTDSRLNYKFRKNIQYKRKCDVATYCGGLLSHKIIFIVIFFRKSRKSYGNVLLFCK